MTENQSNFHVIVTEPPNIMGITCFVFFFSWPEKCKASDKQAKDCCIDKIKDVATVQTD